ncbi:MAG: DUF6794 domain-containing protein [Opitutales bacterium]|jgi:hypothetical protein
MRKDAASRSRLARAALLVLLPLCSPCACSTGPDSAANNIVANHYATAYLGEWFWPSPWPDSQGSWLELRDDGSFTEIMDNYGFKLERQGRWEISFTSGWILSETGKRVTEMVVENNELSLVLGKVSMKYRRENAVPAPLAALPPIPTTLEDAVDALERTLPKGDLARIAAISEDTLSIINLELGPSIRDRMALQSGNDALIRNCGNMHPEEIMRLIIRTLWQRLHKEEATK